MSQNEVSDFGSKMATLRGNVDTLFWDIPIHIYIYILAIALFHHFVLQDAHPETVTPEPRQRVVPDVTPPAVTPYAKLQLAAAKRAENAEKNAKRSQKPAIKLNCDTFKMFVN